MKKIALFLIIVLASCTPPIVVEPPVDEPAPIVTPEPTPEPEPEPPVVVPVPVPNVRVYNSAWEIVQEGYVAPATSRAVTTIQSYADYAAEYNAANTDDQFFVIEGEAIIPIEESPPVDAYIVDPATHDIIRQYLDWPRVDLVDRRELWRLQTYADGGVLYVDRVPPPPIPVIDERLPYEKYALYLIYTATGIIKYEEHMETEAEYIERRAVYLIQESADGGTTYVIAGRLYP